LTRIPLIEPSSDLSPEMAGIFAWVTEMEGNVPNHFKVELNFPEFFVAKLGATTVLWEMGELTMPEVQLIGIAVSQANGCAYCTGAFCTIWNFGLGASTGEVQDFLREGPGCRKSERERAMLDYAIKVNEDAGKVTDEDVQALRAAGFGERGILQITHLVSDFSSYNTLNLALDTEYDYDELWKTFSNLK